MASNWNDNPAPLLFEKYKKVAWWDGDNSYYALVGLPNTWNNANSIAKANGWYLAKIDTPDENSKIISMLLSNLNPDVVGEESYARDGGDAAYIWLGASDA